MKVPTLRNPQFVIRTTTNPREIARANALVYRNYVEDGFWEDDDTQLKTNRFLHSPHRTVFVAEEAGEILGTMSLIADSDEYGLPSDSTQAYLTGALRSRSHLIAEVSAFAMDRTKTSTKRLMLFLIAYMHQYALYYTPIDRLIASCKPEHAEFYESIIGWTKISELTYYDYSHASGYLISLDLIEAHQILSEKYPADADGQSFYRFLLCDPHPVHQFAPMTNMLRDRAQWARGHHRKVA